MIAAFIQCNDHGLRGTGLHFRGKFVGIPMTEIKHPIGYPGRGSIGMDIDEPHRQVGLGLVLAPVVPQVGQAVELALAGFLVAEQEELPALQE